MSLFSSVRQFTMSSPCGLFSVRGTRLSCPAVTSSRIRILLRRIERRSNILMRELVTAGQLKRVPRTENNPHGLLIVNWRTLLNKDIEQKTKSNY